MLLAGHANRHDALAHFLADLVQRLVQGVLPPVRLLLGQSAGFGLVQVEWLRFPRPRSRALSGVVKDDLEVLCTEIDSQDLCSFPDLDFLSSSLLQSETCERKRLHFSHSCAQIPIAARRWSLHERPWQSLTCCYFKLFYSHPGIHRKLQYGALPVAFPRPQRG